MCMRLLVGNIASLIIYLIVYYFLASHYYVMCIVCVNLCKFIMFLRFYVYALLRLPVNVTCTPQVGFRTNK